MTSDTLAIILGGGQGRRLFPLTATRSKPAVPIGGKYRLIDVPISGCLHADIRRILYRSYWVDVGTIESFYDVNVMLGRSAAPFRFWDPKYPIYTHLRHLPGSRLTDCHVRDSIVPDGCYLDRCGIDHSVVGIRTHIQSSTRVSRSVLLGADLYSETAPGLSTSAASSRRTAMDTTSAAGLSWCRKAA